MRRILHINNLTVHVDETPYIKSIAVVLEKTDQVMVLCPEDTAEEDIVHYIFENYKHLLSFEEDQVEANETAAPDSISKDTVTESAEEIAITTKKEVIQPESDPLMMAIIAVLRIKKNPFATKIRFSYNTSLPLLILQCPMDTDEVELYRYLSLHKSAIVKKLHLKVDSPSSSTPSNRPTKKAVVPPAATVNPVRKESESANKVNDGSLCIIEGYSVYRFLVDNRWGHIHAKIVDRDKIFVQVSRHFFNNVPFIKNYVEEKLDKLISDNVASIKKSHFHSDSRVIEKGTFSYTNRRRDITDEEPLRIIKHKLKWSVISPTKTQGYVGETRRNVVGMRAIGPDGRFVTFQRGEDYGLKDRND